MGKTTLHRAACFIGLLCLEFLPLPALAQQPTGTIAGIVTDPSGAVVGGASVTVVHKASRTTVRMTTSDVGAYTVPALLPGDYEVRIEASGFKTTVSALKVEVGRVTSADVRLEVGELTETVTVEANGVRVNPTQTALEGIVTEELIRSLPLNGRNFLELGQLEPGVQINTKGTLVGVAGYNTAIGIAGQSGLQTAVTLDGLSISDDHFGAVLANVSQEAIQEFQVTRSAQDISTGLSGNGAVNIVTRTGGNEFHGTGLFYWRDDKLAARIAEEQIPFGREHFGFSAGGPFSRDRLFWFASYEGINQSIGVATVTPFFPQFTDTWQAPYDERMALARVDWNLSAGLRIFGRFLHNNRRGIEAGGSFGGIEIVPVTQHDFSNQTAAGLDFARGRFTHSFRFGYLNSNLRNESGNTFIEGLPITLDPDGRLVTAHIGEALALGTNSNTPSYRFIDNYETRYDGGVSFGRHSLRWGALTNIIRSNWYEELRRVPEITLEFNADLQQRCGADPLCYPIRGGNVGNGLGWLSGLSTLGFPFGGFKNNRIHTYVADGWRATPRLQVNVGLRWVYEPGPNTPGVVKPAILDEFMAGISRPVSHDTNNLAPQIGLAWDPTGAGKWVLRANAGVFYDNFLLRNNWWVRNNLERAPIAFVTSQLSRLVDPNTNTNIFVLDGSDPNATITPGVNWLSGPQCNDPRLPPGNCALGTPGLLDAVLDAAAAFRAAYALRAEQRTAQDSNCERNRTCQIMDPNYRTPYTLQFSVGFQRELRPGLVLSIDYVRHRGQRFPVRTEANRGGAADTLDVNKAMAAIIATNQSLGCGASVSTAAIDCAVGKGATILSYTNRGLGTGAGGRQARAGVESTAAFDGLSPKFNRFIVYQSRGWSTYNALQVHLRGRLPDSGRGLHNWSLVTSYSLSRLVGTVAEQGLIWLQADDFKFMYGPTSFDRTHVFSLATGFDTFAGLRLNSFWRASSSLPQSVFLQPVRSGNAASAEIFHTDLDGDGSSGDPLPGTNRGSYGRKIGCGGKALNRVIDSYNSTQAGQLTPAGQTLVNAGLFTTTQLKALGAVSPTVPRAPDGQVCLDSLLTTDIRISRPFTLRHERVTIEPAFEMFNVFNVANYDLPASRLDGVLTGLPSSLNGTTPETRTNRAGVTGGTMSLGAPRSWQLVLRVSF
ncbi:MAG: TonB-dependent receptor [Acidobacteria bacterium]|nr:TonB-dependent receptor [Acidobacteriota bacterium]MCL5286636.1 TonB-dependent receptor [Acidobacteriota bacterium]